MHVRASTARPHRGAGLHLGLAAREGVRCAPAAVVADVGTVVGVVTAALLGAAGAPAFASAWPGALPAGVGSNWVQPRPASQTSGQRARRGRARRTDPGSARSSRGEPDRDARRQPDRAGHRGERAGELLAEPAPGPEEVRDRVGAAARRTVQVVGEGPVQEEGLEPLRLLVRVARTGDDPARPGPHRLREGVRQVERRARGAPGLARPSRICPGSGAAIREVDPVGEPGDLAVGREQRPGLGHDARPGGRWPAARTPRAAIGRRAR